MFFHGGIARWQELNPLIKEPEHHWHVYACDHRGHGKSDRAAFYRVVDFLPDTIAFIKDRLGAPTVLPGHPGGAIVALGVVAQIPVDAACVEAHNSSRTCEAGQAVESRVVAMLGNERKRGLRIGQRCYECRFDKVGCVAYDGSVF